MTGNETNIRGLFKAFFIIAAISVCSIYFLMLCEQAGWNKKMLELTQVESLISKPVQEDQHELTKAHSQPKVILLWTPFFGRTPVPTSGLAAQNRNCPFRCEFTTNKSKLNSSHAVLFHGQDLPRRMIYRNKSRIWVPQEIPPTNRSDKFYIFYLAEPPAYTRQGLESYSNFFNLTVSYRHDSDIFSPYYRLLPGAAPPLDNPSNKSKLVVWLVSRCHSQSKREKLVQELKKYIPVDVYGSCGSKGKCSLSGQVCYQNFAKTYKFYLAFENSLCADYITEKFFLPLKHGMVPVVYGGGNYSKHAPKDSYIDVNDFPSMEHLAKYLLFLNENRTEYLKYFEWRKRLHVDTCSYRGWCILCEKLTNEVLPRGKTVPDLRSWWHFKQNRSACWGPSYLTGKKSGH